MAKPRPIEVTETAREERANWRAWCEAGYITAEVYVAKFSAKPPDGPTIDPLAHEQPK